MKRSAMRRPAVAYAKMSDASWHASTMGPVALPGMPGATSTPSKLAAHATIAVARKIHAARKVGDVGALSSDAGSSPSGDALPTPLAPLAAEPASGGLTGSSAADSGLCVSSLAEGAKLAESKKNKETTTR